MCWSRTSSSRYDGRNRFVSRGSHGHQAADFLDIEVGGDAEAPTVAEVLGDGLSVEAIVEQLEMIGGDERGMRDAAGAAERQDVLPQGQDVVRQARGFQRRIDAAHQPRM